MAEEPDQGDAVPQGETLGAGRSGDVRREGGAGGTNVAGGLAEDARQRSVCRAEGGEEFSEERSPVGQLSSGGVPGSGAAGRWLVRKTVAVAVWSLKGELRHGAWPAVATSTGGCVNRRHARSNYMAKWGGGGGRGRRRPGRGGEEGACHAPVAGGPALGV